MFHLSHLFSLFFLVLLISGCPEETISTFAPPQLLVNSPLHFGESPKEVRQRGRLVITNGGDAQLSINDFKLEPDDGIFNVSVQELPLNINGRRSKDLILSFRPKEERTYRAELSFASNHEGDALDPVVLIGEGTSNLVCRPCTPAPEPECHFDGESSLVYMPATSTNCESANNQCSYLVIEIPCGNAPCDELTGLCPDTELPTFDAGPGEPESVCGNGEIEGEEECDDGNTDDGDGCSATCTVEDGWECISEGCEEICGDGEVVGEEECDDGNTTTETECPYGTAACTACNATCSEVLDLTGRLCGDGNHDPEEACDDGNLINETECPYGTASCSHCNSTCDEVLVLAGSTCGDGVNDPEEACDDGQFSATCDTDCTLAECGDGVTNPAANEDCDDSGLSATCDADCSAAVCGDGQINTLANEACDDGNTIPGDGCSVTCAIEDGWECIGEGCEEVCGDGIIVGQEECDDGNTNPGDGCSATCTAEDGWDCTTEPCEEICGDNQMVGDEQCDNTSDNYCTACECPEGYTLNPADNLCNHCGDARVTDAEGCDDGNTSPGDGCSSVCIVEPGWDCTGPNCEAICGDDILAGDEQCDNASDPFCNTCDCPAGYSLNTVDNLCNHCGDDRLSDSEGCDDGNTDPGDGCSATCSVEDGWECTGAGCDTVCGDGQVIAGEEECDDDDTYTFVTELICNYGESCQFCHATTCTIEDGTSSGDCGDGEVNGDEECDDGTNDGSYGTCNADCTHAPRCGDSAIDTANGETCDGTANGIANCRTDCTFCGDTVTDTGEQCDDGNNSEDDSCTNDCQNIVCGDNQITGNENCEMASSIADGVPFVAEYECPHEAAGPTNQCMFCDSNTCKTTVASGPYCGDTEVNGPEECDNDGAYTWALSLTCNYGDTTCSYCKSDSCTISSGAFAGSCGNNILENGTDGSGTNFDEECDNTADSNCTICECPDVPLDYSRNSNTDLCHYCGDGLISDAEKCDTDGDANCSYCTACGTDFLGDEYPINGSVCGFCGDGVLNGGEECDEGQGSNTGLYSGCNNDCSLAAFCGDSVIDDAEGETCDGAADGIEACRGDCSYCGDGVTNAEHGEECDDGKNGNPDDGCLDDCKAVISDYCGDGLRDQHVTLGDSDYIRLPWGQNLGWAPPFTFEGWISPGASGPIWGAGFSSDGFTLEIDNGNRLRLVHYHSDGEEEAFSENVGSMASQWTYFAITVDSDLENLDSNNHPTALVKLYLDDTMAPAGESTFFQNIEFNAPYDSGDCSGPWPDCLGLGSSISGSSTFSGSMDDIRFWNRVLSQSEIASSFAGAMPDNTELLASYSMVFSGDTLVDDTGNAYKNGTYQGSLEIEYSEACDDGNAITETECEYGTQSCVHCNADCTEVLELEGPYCGDGDLDDIHGEVCDDSNTITETECEYNTQSCEVCNDDCMGTTNVTGPYCGDGVPQPANGEACDDGDDDNSNGCSNACTVNVTDVCGDGYLDYTLELDGNYDHVQLPSDQGLGWTSDFTIEGWVFPERSNGTSSIWSYGDSSGGFSLSTTNNNKRLRLDYCYPDGGASTCTYFHSKELAESPTDTWVYFAATLESATDPERYFLRLYWGDSLAPNLLNEGESLSEEELWSSDATDEHSANGFQNSNFGHVFDTTPSLGEGWTGVSAWDGMMDNIRFWSRVLSPAEVFAAKTDTLTSSEGLLTEYGMTDSGSVLVNDLGDIAKDGTLMDDATWNTVEACDDGNTSDGDGCSATCTIEDGWDCSGAPSSCGFATLTEGGESCVDAPPLLYVPGSSSLTATHYQVTADYGYTNNYDGWNGYPTLGCLDYQYGTDNWATSKGDEVIFKVTLPHAHWFYAELQTGNGISGTLYFFEACESSSAEPTFLKCADEYTSTEENNGDYEDLQFYHYDGVSRTFYLGVDAWCMNEYDSSSCPRNASKDFTLIYYVVDHSN